jgi:hypothetical protein
MPEMRVQHLHNKNELNVHVGHIQRLVAQGLRDGDSRRLAVKIVSGRFETILYKGHETPVVTAWGKKFLAPPGKVCQTQDDICEIEKIWDFVVLNIRYVYDTTSLDVFATLKESLISGGGDCFALDTKIIVRSRATGCYELRTLAELKTVWPAYDALSYDFAIAQWVFRPITAWRYQGVRDCVTSHLANGSPFTHTPEHKVWWWDGQNEYKRVAERELGFEPDIRIDRRRVLVARKIPALSGFDISQPEAYLAGIYAAEGNFTGNKPKLSIAQSRIANPHVVDRIGEALAALGAGHRYHDRGRGGSRFHVSSAAPIRDWLVEQGTNSFDMGFHPSLFAAGEDALRTAYEAHADGDAYIPQPGSRWHDRVRAIHATSSQRLIDELQLIAMILGEPWHTQTQADHQGAGSQPIFRFHRWHEGGRVDRRVVPPLPGVGYSPIRDQLLVGPTPVADITVEGTHNFVLSNGLIAHNCDDLTIAFATLLGSIGFTVIGRVISTNDAPKEWAHIFPVVGVPKDNPTKWIPLDASVQGATPGWSYPDTAEFVDYNLTG